MSVRKCDRRTSSLEFYHTALVIRAELSAFAETNFGIHPKIRKVKEIVPNKNMTEQQKIYVKELAIAYSYLYEEKESIDYDGWLMTKCKDLIWNTLESLANNITQANTIYISTYEEYVERKRLQTSAIANCYELFNHLQYILCTFYFVDANRVNRYVERINQEITLLKGWRKSSNKMLKKIQKNGNKENETNNDIISR